MKTKKSGFSIIIIAVLAVLLYLIFARAPDKEAPADTALGLAENPFEIVVTDAKIVRVQREVFEGDILVQKDGEDLRLKISVSIVNSTEQDFQKVWFELELNPETEVFIASKITKFSSTYSMDYFYVTTLEKSTGPDGNDAQFADDGSLMVPGFEHNWNMLLEPVRAPEAVAKASKYINISIYWDGGSQIETIPLNVTIDD